MTSRVAAAVMGGRLLLSIEGPVIRASTSFMQISHSVRGRAELSGTAAHANDGSGPASRRELGPPARQNASTDQLHEIQADIRRSARPNGTYARSPHLDVGPSVCMPRRAGPGR